MAVGPMSSKALPAPLLATRFFSPPLPDSWVSRRRLLQRMTGALHVPVTLVSAAAGSGKSLLVSEWIRTQPDLQAGWLSLEPSDNEWGQFFRYLVGAWQQIFPRVGAIALAEFSSSLSSNTEILLGSLLNDLAAAQQTTEPADAWLVLDDYHCITNRTIHELVAYLAGHLPPRCHLILVTRADPPLPLARWRSRGQLLEIRVSDLRFTLDEARYFFSHAMQMGLSKEQVEVLEERTEGWIAGLQMAALSLKGREDIPSFVRDFGGSHRYVLDYLVEEVVNQQTEEIQQFLLTTAVLEQFCGPLCDALLEATEPVAQPILERLERANLFLIPLDDQRHWFRYHHLFADLLRVRLRQKYPDRIPALQRRAAAWFAESGLWRESIHYALQARDYEYGADLLERAIRSSGLDFLFSGMRLLIEPFPADCVERYPLLKLARAFSMIETSQLDGIKRVLLSAEIQLKEIERADNKLELLGMLCVAQSIAASLLGDSAWILESSQQVNRLLPHHVKANVNALIQLGNVYFFDGDLHQIEAYWGQALDLSFKDKYPFGILCCLDDLGRLCCHRGELNQAEEHFQHALRLLNEEATCSPRWLGSVYRDYADLLRERNRLGDAHAMMTSGLELIEKWDTVSGRGLGYVHLGYILLAEGDQAGAKTMLQKAEVLSQSHTIYPDLATLIQLFRARLSMEAGDLETAWINLETSLKQPHGQHAFHREWLLNAQARILIRRSRPVEALNLLVGRIDNAKRQGRGRNWLEMSLLTSLALHATGEHAKALDSLRGGLTFAEPQGFVRVFVDEGSGMLGLLKQFRQQNSKSPLLDYVNELINGFPEAGAVSQVPLLSGELIEPLSTRELEVLHLVCAGLSNSEISARLVLSVGTVKTHIHNIYGKLGVRDRPQAIAKAVQLGIAEN